MAVRAEEARQEGRSKQQGSRSCYAALPRVLTWPTQHPLHVRGFEAPSMPLHGAR